MCLRPRLGLLGEGVVLDEGADAFGLAQRVGAIEEGLRVGGHAAGEGEGEQGDGDDP